nr:DUF3667 domain-containing protein [uncultured Allomuricauda sp.]
MNSTKKVTLKDFFDEFFSSLVNYDSKLLKTLSALLIRPGTITKDYIKGKRISYTNPFRFLLSLAFLYFLMFTYNSTFSDFDRQFSGFDEKIINQVRPLSYALDSTNVFNDSIVLNENAQEALKQLDSLDKNELKITETLQGLDSITNFDPKKFKENNDSLILSDPAKYFKSLQKENSTMGRTMKKMDFFTVVIRKDSIYSFNDAVAKYQIENRRSNRMPFNAAASLLRVIQAPGSFINATIGKLPFVIFFFLPIFTAFIWLVYIRKKYTYTDHLIFSFHNQSLLFILLILSLIIDTIFGTASAGWFLLIFGIYLYKAMRKFYGQGRFKTIVKYIFLNTIFVFLAFFTAILLFAGSAFVY